MGFKLSNFIGSKKGNEAEPTVDRDTSQIYQVDLLNYEDRDLVKYCARVAVAASEGFPDTESVDTLVKNYKNGKHKYIDVTLPSFAFHPRFDWGLKFHHRAKTGEEPLSWREWSKKPKSERSEYYAKLWYGVRAKKEQDPDPLIIELDELTPEDLQYIEPFLENFWKLAQACLGVKFDDAAEQPTLSDPQITTDTLKCFIGIPGTEFYIKCDISMPLTKYQEMSGDDQDKVISLFNKVADFVSGQKTGYAEYRLGNAPDSVQTGPEITDFDLLCMAADAVQARPGSRPGYADEVKEMIRKQEKAGRTIDVVIIDMEGSGKYAAVLAEYEKLKKNPPKTGDSEQSTPPASAPGPTTPAPASSPTQPAPTAPVPVVNSTLRGLYEQQEQEYRAYARSKKPTDWDDIVTAIPEISASFAEARKNELADLPYMDMTAFGIAMFYIDKTGGNMLSCITKLCDIELAAAAAKKQAASA